jgi:hypothetical protein
LGLLLLVLAVLLLVLAVLLLVLAVLLPAHPSSSSSRALQAVSACLRARRGVLVLVLLVVAPRRKVGMWPC